jgi:membrane protein DedA with SNARE-associated domain
MRLTLIVAVIAFIALPPDAQLWLVGIARVIWLTEPGQAFLAGALGATVTAMLWYAAGWNALADRIYHEDMSRARETLSKRRRG